MNIEDIERLEALSRIQLTIPEREAMLSDMKGILEYVKVIESVEVGDIKTEYTLHNVWREDEVIQRDFSSELLTGQFPDQQEGFLKVKKIL